MARADLDVAVQAALVLMKNPDRFPTAETAARAIAQIVKEVDGAELLATLRRRLNPADLPSDLAQPEGLCHCGVTAWQVITDFLRQRDLTYTGGCRAFYSAREWRERGEQHGTNALLVVVHDGGELSYLLNAAKEGCPKNAADLVAALAGVGLYVESQTAWYSAVYALDTSCQHEAGLSDWSVCPCIRCARERERRVAASYAHANEVRYTRLRKE